MKTGDKVTIECDGRTVPGKVTLASGNGKSLVLEFEAVINGHLGMMPVSQLDDGSYESLMTGIPVKLKPTA